MDKNLEKRIEELEKIVKGLQNSSTIPFSVERSLMGRGFINTGAMGEPPSGWETNTGFRLDLAAIGGPIVQAPALVYLRIKGSSPGESWFIPLYNFDEIS